MTFVTHRPYKKNHLSARVRRAHYYAPILVLVCVAISVQAGQRTDEARESTGGPDGAEVKKIVTVMTGTWVGQMKATVGLNSEVFRWTMDCEVVALGAGAACTNGGTASIGRMAESCLLAYDPVGKAVHYMCVTSMGEVHDHKGHWKDGKTIEFEPLQAGMLGKTTTETLSWTFPDATRIAKTSEVRMADGSSMKFEFTGERNSAPPVNSRK